MHGTPILMGDNTIPGLKIPKELDELLPNILKAVKDFGCDCYPTVVQMLAYDEMSEVCAYGGFPVRYPHWRWGMEYEELQRGYGYGMHRIYEIVINTNPCYIYCLNSNTLLDNVTVVAHAMGHNDFFKNNIFFAPTNQNMLNELANNGTRIRQYMRRWGREKVGRFIDHVLRLETLIDPSKAWEPKKVKDINYIDKKVENHPYRLEVEHDYMDDYINSKEWLEKQKQQIAEQALKQERGIFSQPTKDILGFLRDHAPLKAWQQDIVAMLYQESMYFAPQRTTQMMNEGWASYIDHNIIAKEGLCSLGQGGDDCGIIEYALHKAGVLGGKYSSNPYKIGYYLFQEIEERWNKGRFGREYEECNDISVKNNWDTKAGLGHKKVFEVRKHYNDVMAINEFFTEEFCNKHEFFEWRLYPNGEYRIENRDYKSIKQKLMDKYYNGGLPDVVLMDCNYRGKGYLFLQHKWSGKVLYGPYVKAVMESLCFLWQNNVYLATCDQDGNEIVFVARQRTGSQVIVVDRETLSEHGNKIDSNDPNDFRDLV